MGADVVEDPDPILTLNPWYSQQMNAAATQ